MGIFEIFKIAYKHTYFDEIRAGVISFHDSVAVLLSLSTTQAGARAIAISILKHFWVLPWIYVSQQLRFPKLCIQEQPWTLNSSS
jgi:hypothetical protein